MLDRAFGFIGRGCTASAAGIMAGLIAQVLGVPSANLLAGAVSVVACLAIWALTVHVD